MAEKLPSPPLKRIATKVVGESPEDRVKDVLKSEYSYLRENLSIDSEVASKLFGWSPQLLGDPPYREILSLNERGKHFDAFERWYQFAESSYTEDRLKVFCECLGEIGSPTRPKLIEVGRRVFEMLVGEPMSDFVLKSEGAPPHDRDILSRAKPHFTMSGSVGKRSSVGTDVSLAKRKTTNYSDIPASDVVSRFGKEKLIGECKRLIHGNVARLPLLEARDLINSAYRDIIEARLNHGQSSLAATELVEYFEVNHDGVKMEEFCVFVENQAGKSSTQLLKFAKKLKDCIIQLALASHGSSKHTDESEPSPSQLATNEAKVEANPNPFLPPQFPPTGSPAAQGPSSQLLLGPSSGMPLPMPPQAPGTFPPGMGVPPGFGSQPMGVSQPLWGIPPTSKVSLAPSVSTEQANPNPFLPSQFPPTGSPAARGPPSQLLLGPPPGMPLPIPSQVPGAFPQGMGVPPGFGSQPMSLSQPFWGIPPTSTVSLAPSVSTEQGPLDSPHIHRLRDHLYKRYTTYKIGEGGKKMEFVRLAVLEGQVNVPRDEEEIHDKLAFLQRFRNCGKERQIAGYIDSFDLLHKSNHRIRVVYGQPGIGKTTLLTHLCRALAMKEADSEYTLVLYFPLRNKKVSGAKTLKELLSYFCPMNDDKLDLGQVKQAMVSSEEKQMLIILDGADEVRELFSIPDSSVIQEILSGTTLPQTDVIVSSRPGSLPFLQDHSSSFYEIHGFDQASIEHYVKDFFKGTPEKAEKMMKELHSRPDLLGGAHIPMNLFIYCSVYDYGGLPPTMTECHKKFLCNVVKREYKKCGVPCQVDPSLSRMSSEVKGLFESLGALAYEGMMKNPPVFVLDESDIRRAFPTLPPEAVVEESIFKGLLVQHSCTVGYEEVNTFNFSHTTNHEFFVAWHISHLPEADQLQFVREHFSNPKFAVVVRFYSGLTGLSTPGVAPLLSQTVSARSTSSVSSPTTSFSLPSQCSNHDPSLLYLFHALYESQNSKLTQNIVQHLNQSLVFTLFLTCHDTLAIAYCLGKCTHLEKLLFPGVVVKLPPSSLPHMFTILKANSHLLSLYLPVEHLSSTDATALISGTAVEQLDLDVGEITLSALSAIFYSRTTKELRLNISSLSKDCDSGKEKQDLFRSVSENATLRKLVLLGSSDYMTAVLHGVAASATIEDLEVDGGEHDVAEALAKCVVNTKLRRVQMEDLPPLSVLKSLTAREVPLEELVIKSPLWEEDGDFQEVERTAANIRIVRKLVLYGPSDSKIAVLHGVAASATIEDLEVHGFLSSDGGEHDVAEALAKCVVNIELRRVKMEGLPALSVMKALTTREVPLEEIVISYRFLRRGAVFSEDHLKEMERSAAKIRVRKVDFDVDYNTALHDAVSSGLGENKCLQEVALRCVPEEKKQFVQSKLSAGHETDLLNQCWIPFGIESLLVTKEGGIFPLEPLTPEHRDDINRTFRMEVPANAIRSDTLEVMYGIILDGPFVLPRGYRFASPLVYVCFDESKVIKPLKIHIPHWIAQAKDHSEDDVLFIISPHSVSEGEQMYKFTAMESRCTSTLHDVYGTVEISGHNSLVGQAMEEKIPSCYYASSWERMDGHKRYLRVAIMYCIPLWLKVLEEYWSAEAWKCSDKVRQSFEVTGDSMEGKLRSSHGPGWEARLNQLAINTKFVAYDSYKRENLESAVKINLYPPCFLVEVLQTVSPSVNVVPRFLHLDIMGTTSKELYFSIEVNEEAVDNAGNPSCNVQLSSPTPENMSFSSPQRPPFHELSPSDIGLSGTLKAIPCWQRLAVNLGVSVDQVQAFQSDPLGDLLALKCWRDGNCGQMFPTTWRFLLQTIEHTIRKKVAKDLEKMASREPTWSQ